MRSLVFFLAVTQITAAAIFFVIEIRAAENPIAEISAFSLPVQILVSAFGFGLASVLLTRRKWTRAIGLLVALVLPVLFVAHDMGLPLQ